VTCIRSPQNKNYSTARTTVFYEGAFQENRSPFKEAGDGYPPVVPLHPRQPPLVHRDLDHHEMAARAHRQIRQKRKEERFPSGERREARARAYLGLLRDVSGGGGRRESATGMLRRTSVGAPRRRRAGGAGALLWQHFHRARAEAERRSEIWCGEAKSRPPVRPRSGAGAPVRRGQKLVPHCR
jgi:hypothetical protein